MFRKVSNTKISSTKKGGIKNMSKKERLQIFKRF